EMAHRPAEIVGRCLRSKFDDAGVYHGVLNVRPRRIWVFACPLTRPRKRDAKPRETPASFGGNPLGGLSLGDQLARQRNQLPAVFDRIDQRVKAADQKVADAEVVVIAEDFRDLLWRSNQRRRVAV